MAETPTAGTAETPMVATLRHKINPKNGFLFLFSVNCPFYNFIRIIIMVLRVFVYQFFKFDESGGILFSCYVNNPFGVDSFQCLIIGKLLITTMTISFAA
jgi:hypothetical protein